MGKKVLHIIQLTIALLLIGKIADCQDYIYKQFTTEDGLPSSEVYHVFQDSKGYIWFATDNGVSRYNGYEFENFDVNDGLPESAISEIYEDFKGRIWFIGITAKLAYFDNGRVFEYQFNFRMADVLQQNPIYLKTGFYIDSIENIYISVKGFGLLRITSDGEIFRYEQKLHLTKVQIINELPNKIKIPAASNLGYESPESNLKKITYKCGNSTTEIELPEHSGDYPQHLFISQINYKSFWYGSDKHIYLFENMEVTFFKNFNEKIVWMQQDQSNNLWVCPMNEGAYCYSHSEEKLVKRHHVLNSQTVTSVLQDNYGSYWFSTLNKGVFYIQSIDLINLNKKTGLIDDITKSIEIHNDTIWVGYNLNKISEISKNNIGEYSFSGIFSYSVRALYFDDKTNQLLVPTSGYLFFIHNKKVTEFRNNFFLIKEPSTRTFNATDVVSDKNNGFWICGGGGFYHLQNNIIDFDSEHTNKLSLRINSLLLDRSNTLWLGCRDGLRSFKTNQLQYWGDKYEKLKYRILDILEHKDNTLILATKGKGILFFNGDTVLQIRKSEGLTSNTITCMALQDNILWAGSLNGLDRIELPGKLDNLKQIEILNLNELSGFEINQMKLHDSCLYVASNKGVVIWPLNKINNFNPSIPFAFKSMTINGISGSITNEYRLNHEQNNFTISFEALLYSAKTQIQYKYRLNGLDTNWIYTSNREARYYHIPPGKYEFVAMVKNRAGEWGDNSIHIKINIVPSIWQTAYFKIGIGIFLLTVLIMLYKLNVVSTKQKASLKKNMYTYMMQALVGQMNPHFIFNTLNSINNYILANDKRAASTYLVRFSKLIRRILNNSRQMYVTLEEEIEAIKLYLEIEALRIKNKFEYTIEFSEEIEPSQLKIPSMLIQPYIENSIWHGIQPSDKHGIIKIIIKKKVEYLVIDIIDNGVGRKNSNKKKPAKEYSLGTKITASRFDLLEKTLNKKAKVEYSDLNDNSGCMGTKVTITLPVIQ